MASSNPSAPKILLAKPTLTTSASPSSSFNSSNSNPNLRSRIPPHLQSLNLLSNDTWDNHFDRALPYLTENTEFKVVGVIGATGVGKSTILNEIYGFDASSVGMLPPFATQTEETRSMARHCTTGMELKVSSDRIILLDTQPMFSPSVLAEIMRPDGFSTISLQNGEVLSAELAHELMCIQLGVFLASICHVLLVVSEGIRDTDMWRLMLTVDLLKHGLPDPSLLVPPSSLSSNLGSEKEKKDRLQEVGEGYLATPIFVNTKLQDNDLSSSSIGRLRAVVSKYFNSSSFAASKEQVSSVGSSITMLDTCSRGMNLFALPCRDQDDAQEAHHESYAAMLGKLRDQMLWMDCQPFAKTVTEKEWLKNSARVWEMVRKSPVIAEYGKSLQKSGMFRR